MRYAQRVSVWGQVGGQQLSGPYSLHSMSQECGRPSILDNCMCDLCLHTSASVLLLANASHLSPTLVAENRLRHSGRGRNVNIH